MNTDFNALDITKLTQKVTQQHNFVKLMMSSLLMSHSRAKNFRGGGGVRPPPCCWRPWSPCSRFTW